MDSIVPAPRCPVWLEYLNKNSAFEVMSFGYASTRVPLKEDAKSLALVISRLEDVKEISFVAHSMGNLVVRHFLHDQLVAARGLGNDPRIQRIVMLAPPNNGAALARRFQYDPTFRLLFGTGGQQFTSAMGGTAETPGRSVLPLRDHRRRRRGRQ